MLFIISLCFSFRVVFWIKLSKARTESESEITWNISLSVSSLSARALSSEIFPSLSASLLTLLARASLIWSTWNSDYQSSSLGLEHCWPDVELPPASCRQLCPAVQRQLPTTMWRDMLQLLCVTKTQLRPSVDMTKLEICWLYLYCMKTEASQRYVDNEYYDRYNYAENDEDMAVLSTSSQ